MKRIIFGVGLSGCCFLAVGAMSRGAAAAAGDLSLHNAAKVGDVQMIQRLLKAGVDINGATQEGYTALHLAVENRRGEVIRLLLENGANHALGDCNGQTPLHYAARSGLVGAVLLLIRAGAQINAKTKDGSTPLHYAVWEEKIGVMEALLKAAWKARIAIIDEPDKYGYTALHLAAFLNKQVIIELLIRFGANRDLKTSQGEGVEDVMKRGHYSPLPSPGIPRDSYQHSSPRAAKGSPGAAGQFSQALRSPPR